MNTRLAARAANGLSRRAIGSLLILFAAVPLESAIPSMAAEQAMLAIKGYDPVAYFTDGKPEQGSPEFEYQWDGHRYRFSSERHRELFKADPAHYAPQFGNLCAMALSKAEIVVADPENWLVSDGKLYVFGKPAPAGPALFEQDLAGNIARAKQNWTIVLQH
jgi:YHS domain-containing protein